MTSVQHASVGSLNFKFIFRENGDFRGENLVLDILILLYRLFRINSGFMVFY